jgi:RimJ/RimL family protein N-acetyltransferase
VTRDVALETPRLVLRELTDADAPAVHAYASDAEVVRHVDWGPNSVEDTAQFLAVARDARNALPRAAYHLAIVLRATGRLIGGCRISVRGDAKGNGDLGYVLDRRHWGHGYATEATRALVDFGFGRLELHRIWATCDVDNHGSDRVLEKVGMRREGHLRQIGWRQGQWRDSYLYAILQPEWRDQPRGPG